MTIKTDYSKAFSYARMQNGVKAVRSVVIKNNGAQPISKVRLNISFDPPFSTGFETVISGLDSKQKVILDDISILPSPTFLANLTERVNGKMAVTCETEEEGISREEYPVSLLPYDFWEGVVEGAGLLASFVVPNHPEIRPILSRASEKLGQWTGNPALNGYSDVNPNRVKMQMAAIYEALVEKGITYAIPPASFAEQGQRIRLPEDIFSGGFATCLDAALLYAGCLEASGLRPLVILHEGHAYGGCWLIEKTSPYPVNDDPTSLRKSGADGINEVLLVETTGFLKGTDMAFDAAVSAASTSILDVDSFLMFVDIREARRLGFQPIPQRILTPEGYVIDESTIVHETLPERVAEADIIDINAPAKVDKHTIWERKLLDLSLRNDLVNIHSKKGALQLVGTGCGEVVGMLEDGAGFNIFGIPEGWFGAIDSGGFFREVAPGDPLYSFSLQEITDKRLHSFKPEDETTATLNEIRKEARRSLEENGANTMYLTAGALKWIDADSSRAHYAPILLIPVEMTKSTWSVKWSGEDIMANLTLLEMLRQQHGISIPGLAALPEKGDSIDVRKVLNIVRRAVMEQKGWDVEELMFLGNFTFNKFIIWNDIHTHRQMLDSHPAISSLIEGKLRIKDPGSPEGSIDDLCPAGKVLQPISADSSQLRAIRDAISGRSFVMHGPPGTGKSQTITNIIANTLYKGKRVLFVSEKKAALEVVQKRLEEIGLDPFCLELHSNKARKSTVLAKLDKLLSMPGGNTGQSESFSANAVRIDEERALLDDHAEGLNRIYPAGMSLYDCVSRYLSLPEGLQTHRLLDQSLPSLTETGFKDMESAVNDYVTAILHTGIGPDCELLDLPVIEYSPEGKDRLLASFRVILGKSGLSFWWNAMRLEKRLGVPIGVMFSSKAMASVREKISRWRENLDGLKMYVIYSKQKARLRGMGLGFIPEAFETGEIEPAQIKDFFYKSFYRSYARHIIGKEKGLGIFCGDLFESLIIKFRRDDANFRELTRKELYSRISSRLPGIGDPLYNGSEMTILKKAIRNNSRGVSLRRLFEQIPNLLPRLCPCMLMSPLSVSQYLRAESGQFDLVVFDEASQLPTSEAVASIARGRSLVVVGDPKQLPPTSFFESNIFDEENAEKEDMESILDECIALSLPSIHLKWHYRSSHESLIAFSNANYYDNSLLTFPSNDDLASRVTFRQIEGVYDRGRTRTNEAEADAIVQEVKRRLSDPAEQDKSIGIVSFNVSQKDLIEKKLENLFAKDKALGRIASSQADPIFVKSLENVQGDERDVILFSIGYGTDRKGRVSMNFGPLNQDGGWRRLNVAVSRARREMVIFSSLQPEQISEEWFVPKGVKDLKAFLKYARDGRESLDIPKTRSRKEDLFAEMIADELRSEGLTVNTGVGTSDFRVDVAVVDKAHPGNYLYGILLDGPGYASAEAARDREIIRPQILKRLGWTIKRKWILDKYDE